MKTREQYAWAAGVFDGEGNIMCGRQKHTTRKGEKRVYRRPVMRVSQTAKYGGVPQMITRLHEVLGGKIGGPYARKEPNAKQVYTWCVASYEDVQYTLCRLWPWIGRQKRLDALGVINEYLENRPPMEWRRGNEKGIGSRPDRQGVARDPKTGRFI